MTGVLFILFIVLLIEVLIQRKRIAKLEKFQQEKEREYHHESQFHRETKEPQTESEKKPGSVAAHISDTSQVTLSSDLRRRDAAVKQPSEQIQEPKKPARPVFTEPKESDFGRQLNSFFHLVKAFFTTGNVVLKVGIIILFFGVAFLLKYAAQHSLISIELRLIGVGVGAIVLLIIGWVIARNKPLYGLSLQGGGVGIFYLTIFAASRLYGLLPHSLSLSIMIGLVCFSCILAILQDSKSLAAFGISGGFLAPVLVSTGSGSHVMLFSYYGLLNCGIVGIAWFKAWRELNLVGFFFTFVISAFWGYNYYQPGYFTTTEPFLLFFFGIYVAVSILFAHRQPIQLKGYVDSTLVFGLPIVFFGMQASLVESFKYGVALSALGLGLFYIIMASLLLRKLVEGMRALTEAFVALGVVFGSLAIPFALDGNLTASTWALEGGALVWVGLRQNRLRARVFGLLLQIAAAASFLLSGGGYISPDEYYFVNQITMSGAFIAIGALFSAYHFSRKRDALYKWEKYFQYILMGWGLLWWFGTGINDIGSHYLSSYTLHFILLFIAISVAFFLAVTIKTNWPELGYPLLGFLPILVFVVMADFHWLGEHHYFRDFGGGVWLISLLVNYALLKLFDSNWPEKVLPWYHLVSLWLLIFLVTIETSWLVHLLIHGSQVWPFVCLTLIPGCCVVLLIQLGEKISWPVAKFKHYYLDHGVVLILIWMVIWSILADFQAGLPAPLPYIPVVNPLTVCQIFTFLIIFYWMQKNWEKPTKTFTMLHPMAPQLTLGLLIFFWLNGVTARLIHVYFHVPYRLSSLFDSVIFQSAISILWSAMALSITIWATRKRARYVWFAGACLLAGVVVKLFLIDLSGTGTIARIVSFMAVGILMLLVGYFSPLPPKEEVEDV